MDSLPEDIAVKYRGATQGDIHFILHSWMKSLRNWRFGIPTTHFYNGQQRLIAALAEKSRLVVCCDAEPNMESFVFGWACGEMDVPKNVLTLHYVYIKNGYRLAGLGRALIAELGYKPGTAIIATHMTGIFRACHQRYNAEFSDYPLMIGNQDV